MSAFDVYSVYLAVKDKLPGYRYLLDLDDSIYISGIIYKKEHSIPGRVVEEGETVEKGPHDIWNYMGTDGNDLAYGIYPEDAYGNPNWYKLRSSEIIENSKKEIGFDSGNDDLIYVQYLKEGGVVYVRFKDGDYYPEVTPWIRMDYWNKYGTFRRVPRSYLTTNMGLGTPRDTVSYIED